MRGPLTDLLTLDKTFLSCYGSILLNVIDMLTHAIRSRNKHHSAVKIKGQFTYKSSGYWTATYPSFTSALYNGPVTSLYYLSIYLNIPYCIKIVIILFFHAAHTVYLLLLFGHLPLTYTVMLVYSSVFYYCLSTIHHLLWILPPFSTLNIPLLPYERLKWRTFSCFTLFTNLQYIKCHCVPLDHVEESM